MKILLLGHGGQVGWELRRALAPLGELVSLGTNDANFDEPVSLRPLLRRIDAQLIVNAAAYTAVDKAESEPEKARRINADAVGVLAQEAARSGAWLVHYSTDYVFDGEKSAPYLESDVTNPLSIYGQTKLQGEQLIQESGVNHFIFRTSWVYSARGSNFAKTMLRLAKERQELKVVADQYGAPTSAELIADVTALVLYRLRGQQSTPRLSGIYHLVASGCATWHEYAQYVLQLAQERGVLLRASPADVKAIPSTAYPVPARRPMNSRLDTSKLCETFELQMPDWRQHVRRMMDELQV